MGHLLFCILHFICIFITFGIGLFITIPLHIIYSVLVKKKEPKSAAKSKMERKNDFADTLL